MHKENIDHIIEHGTREQMVELKEVLEDAVTHMKECCPSTYNGIEYRIHKIAHEGHLGEELAKKWVDSMVNKDGTKGAHWTWEQVAQVNKEKHLGDELAEVYVVVNMMYSDYYNSKFDTNTYLELAKDWLADKDVNGCKTLKYYYYVAHK
jgi:hypothetical protein